MKTKRILALLLCAVLLVSLAACSANKPAENGEGGNESIDPGMMSFSAQSVSGGIAGGDQEGGDLPSADATGRSGFFDGTITDTNYLMIYNPMIYDERGGYFQDSDCSTGDFGDQIMTNINRADGLNELEFPTMISQSDLFDITNSTGLESDAHRAGGLDPVHTVGETYTFGRYNAEMNERFEADFTCVYEGSYCYVWSTENSITAEQAKPIADEFDANVFEQDTEAFGHGRFTENGGKVNILFYPVMDGLLGFFTLCDIFTQEDGYNGLVVPNYDHAIITINTQYIDQPEDINRTLAHEYQHQICASDTLVAGDGYFMVSWLNEAMSAYAEELTYPGSKFKSGYNQCMYLSNNYREGQSLYNFDNEFDIYIGDYGIVFLFEEYLRRENGNDVFSKVHSYWRENADSEASALASSVTEDFYSQISSSVAYPSAISSGFNSTDEEWMSKLTLSFLLETNDMEFAKLSEYADRVHLLSLYDSPYAADIEGGGRIIVALQNGSYQIPADADGRLVYVALDNNFEPTGMYTKDGQLSAGEAGAREDSGDSGTPGTATGTGFPCNGSKNVRVLSLSNDTHAADAISSGIVKGLNDGYTLSATETFASHDDLITALRDAESSGNCGIVIVFLNDKSYSASGLSLVIEDLAKAGIVTVLANSQVPAGVLPWLFTYDYSRIAFTYTELCYYYASDLEEVGVALGDYLKTAISDNDPVAIQHE